MNRLKRVWKAFWEVNTATRIWLLSVVFYFGGFMYELVQGHFAVAGIILCMSVFALGMPFYAEWRTDVYMRKWQEERDAEQD